MKRLFVLTISIFTLIHVSAQNGFDTVFTAADKIGEEVVIKGTLESTYYCPNVEGKPLFIHVDAPYKDNPLSIVIFKDHRMKFHVTEEWENKEVIIKGQVSRLGSGRPVIIIREVEQLTILGIDGVGY